ncbi:helix-turn-helix domain-containing protein [Murinocardiopsis flavida]|uniref:helix-turn-helix domain-containing protein n=1 Tax=Murinocardiopsis flavida TaxID=645275 RepID=UPI003743CF7F
MVRCHRTLARQHQEKSARSATNQYPPARVSHYRPTAGMEQEYCARSASNRTRGSGDRGGGRGQGWPRLAPEVKVMRRTRVRLGRPDVVTVSVLIAAARGRPVETGAAVVQNQVMTVAEMARELRFDRTTVYRWVRLGNGPRTFLSPGGRIRVYRSDFIEWASTDGHQERRN